MIKVNLAPDLEIEDNNWWYRDAALLALTMVVYFVANMGYATYMNNLQAQIENESAKYRSDQQALSGKLKKYKNLTDQTKKLEDMIKALSKLYENEKKHLRPIVWLETIQRMKPGNLWFSNVKLAEFGSKLEIVGGADNNNTIAEFIKNLRSVSESDANDEDPRTWFTAENIQLDEVKRDSGGAFPGLEDLPQFALRFSSVDRVNSETEDSSK